MKGDPDVIAALNAVYGLILPTEEQAHRQEHQCESDGYVKVANWFHCIESGLTEEGPRLRHFVMKRINALGSQADAAYAFDADPARPIQQLDQAVGSMVERLYALHRAYAFVCQQAETAEPYDDYVTQSMVWGHLEWVEKQIGKFEDRQSQIAEMGVEGYLQEMFDK